MDGDRFDQWSRRYATRLTRRGLSGVAGSLALLGLATKAGARTQQETSRPRSFNTFCLNLGTPCSDTRRCECRLDKNSEQLCVNVVEPPDERGFVACQQNVNCDDGQVCDATDNVCRQPCATLTPPPSSTGSGGTSCQNLGTPCGNTAICQCRLDKSSAQTCQNVVIPPAGDSFRACDTSDDCGAGQVCDATESVCRSTCAN